MSTNKFETAKQGIIMGISWGFHGDTIREYNSLNQETTKNICDFI
jgi:hypothetical protein